MRSYCCTCDAPQSTDCGHDSLRYLDPIVYERTEFGCWRVPDSERERWDNPVLAERRLTNENIVPIARLIVQLEAQVLLDELLEKRIRNAYEAEPGKVSRIVEHVTEQARQGKLSSPGGLLISKLRDIGS